MEFLKSRKVAADTQTTGGGTSVLRGPVPQPASHPKTEEVPVTSMQTIDRFTANSAASTYQTAPTAGTSAATATQGTASVHHRAHSADSVSLSDSAKTLAAAREATQSAPDVRDQKVNAIKQQISDGTYSVPSRVLARTMVSQIQGQSPE